MLATLESTLTVMVRTPAFRSIVPPHWVLVLPPIVKLPSTTIRLVMIVGEPLPWLKVTPPLMVSSPRPKGVSVSAKYLIVPPLKVSPPVKVLLPVRVHMPASFFSTASLPPLVPSEMAPLT